MRGRIQGCALLGFGLCAGMLGRAALGGAILAPIAGQPESGSRIAARLDAEDFAPPKSPWQLAPAVVVGRVSPSSLQLAPERRAAEGGPMVLSPMDAPATATFIRSFPIGAHRAVAPSLAQASRPIAGVIPPPELPAVDQSTEEPFAARPSARSGIMEFFTVPSPAGALAFIPLGLAAARRRRGC